MPRYRIARNRIAIVIIHVNTYLIILELIEWELQCSDLDYNERIRLRLVYLEFQWFFYAGITNGFFIASEDC